MRKRRQTQTPPPPSKNQVAETQRLRGENEHLRTILAAIADLPCQCNTADHPGACVTCRTCDYIDTSDPETRDQLRADIINLHGWQVTELTNQVADTQRSLADATTRISGLDGISHDLAAARARIAQLESQKQTWMTWAHLDEAAQQRDAVYAELAASPIVNALADKPGTIDELMERCGIASQARAASLLASHTTNGWVENDADSVWSLTAKARRILTAGDRGGQLIDAHFEEVHEALTGS